MKLDKSILACTAHDITRYAINEVYLDCAERLALATDGKMLVAVPITPDDNEVSGYISKDAILAAAKLPKSQRGSLTHLEKVTMVGGVMYPNPFADDPNPPTFPQWKQLPPKGLPPPLLALDGDYLERVATALTPWDSGKKPVVTLAFDPTNPTSGPILVKRPQGEGETDAWDTGFGLVMPCRVEEVSGYAMPGAGDLADLRQTIAVMTGTIAELRAENTTLRSERNRLEQDNAVLQDANQILQADRSRFHDELDALRSATPASETSLADSLAKLQAQYAAMEARFAELAEAHAAIQEEYEIVLRDIAELTATVQDPEEVPHA